MSAAELHAIVPFCFHNGGDRGALHPLPTRRSSDLLDTLDHSTFLVFHDNLIDAVVARANYGQQQDRGGNEAARSEEHTSELQSPCNLVCPLLPEKKNIP